MNEVIVQATRRRRLLSLAYDGFARAVEPHIYGIGRDGHELLSAWQVAGGSSSGVTVGWKMFRLDRVSGLKLQSTTFAVPRPDYNPADSHIAEIHAEL